ncbi:hypothetical protein I0Q91_00940 [Halanaerobiaceae bacterium Z-7014]|uniref:Tetratricopeptide repeat protein n=1 Tax=Halonatronomonas betaini TaxID=2778430 RepID=A0A931ANL7_9FIRM|nr:hypothetical protein [Halonatronomonas betaini]MBF8435632.1 hypothetical protein [Halonatronomonas betaini]
MGKYNTNMVRFKYILSFIIIFVLMATTGIQAESDYRYRRDLDELAREFYSTGNVEEIKAELDLMEENISDKSDLEYNIEMAELELFRAEVAERIGNNQAENHLENALEFAERAVELEDNALTNRLIAEAYIHLFNYKSAFFAIRNGNRALGYLERSLELAPDDLLARFLEGNYLLNAPSIGGGDPDKGREILLEITEEEHHVFNFIIYNILEKEAKAAEIYPESPWLDLNSQ